MLSPSYAGPSLLDEVNAARERVRHRSIAITVKSSRARRAERTSQPSADFPIIPADLLKKCPSIPETAAEPAGSAQTVAETNGAAAQLESWRLAVRQRKTSCGASEFQTDQPPEDLSDSIVPTLLIDCWCDDVDSGYEGSLTRWFTENV